MQIVIIDDNGKKELWDNDTILSAMSIGIDLTNFYMYCTNCKKFVLTDRYSTDESICFDCLKKEEEKI